MWPHGRHLHHKDVERHRREAPWSLLLLVPFDVWLVDLLSEVHLHVDMAFTTETNRKAPKTYSSFVKRLECPVDADAKYCNDKWTSNPHHLSAP